jgi:hypothetical protein
MKFEINSLYQLSSGRHMPRGLNIWQRLWWRYVPGVIINVRWPTGEITAGPGPEDPRWFDWGGAAYVTYESADPNDHYRPEMEKYCGQQGWDWNWGIAANDVIANRLTIKIRRKYANYATLLAMKWA